MIVQFPSVPAIVDRQAVVFANFDEGVEQLTKMVHAEYEPEPIAEADQSPGCVSDIFARLKNAVAHLTKGVTGQ